MIGFAACKNEGPTESATAENPSPEETVVRYKVVVDNLSLRDKPTQIGSQVLLLLKQGQSVVYLGETSEQSDRIVLRGVEYNEPWHRVRTADGKEGWLFGGGLRKEASPIAGGRSENIDEAKLSQFSTQLAALPKKKPESSGRALALFEEIFSSSNGATADAGYELLGPFYSDMEMEINAVFDREAKLTVTDLDRFQDEIWALDEGGSGPKMERNPYTKRLYDNYFTMTYGEGSLYVERDVRRIAERLRPSLSNAMKKYTDLEAIEQTAPFADDAQLSISATTLAQRALVWEAFVQENPDFVLSKNADWYKWNYRDMLFNGLDNSRSYSDAHTGRKLEPDFKSAYQWMQSRPDKTELVQSISGLYDLLSKNGFVRDKSVEQYIQQQMKNRPKD